MVKVYISYLFHKSDHEPSFVEVKIIKSHIYNLEHQKTNINLTYVLKVFKYRVIHKSVKHFKNSQQIDTPLIMVILTSIERETVEVFLRKSPRTLLP